MLKTILAAGCSDESFEKIFEVAGGGYTILKFDIAKARNYLIIGNPGAVIAGDGEGLEPQLDFIAFAKKRTAGRSVLFAVCKTSDGERCKELLDAGADDIIDNSLCSAVLRKRIENLLGEKLFEKSSENIGKTLSLVSGGFALYEITKGKPKMIYCSDGLSGVCGRTQEEMRELVENGDSGIFEPDKPKIRNALDMAKKGKEINTIFRMVCKDGSLLPLRLRGRMEKRTESVYLFHAFYTSLASEMQLFQDIMGDTETAIRVCDIKDRGLLYKNEAANRIGVQHVGGGRCFKRFMLPAEREENCVCDMLFTGGTCINEDQWEGRFYKIRTRLVNFGGEIAIAEYVDDVTDTHIAKIIIDDEKEKITNIIENIKTGVAVFQKRGDKVTLLTKNTLAAQLMGGGRFPDRNLAKEDRKTFIEFCTLVLLRGENSAVVHYKCIKGGVNTIFLQGKKVLQPKGEEHIYITYTDVSGEDELSRRLDESYQSFYAAIKHSKIEAWEYDMNENCVHKFAGETSAFSVSDTLSDYPYSYIKTGLVHESDEEKFIENTLRVKNGEDGVSFDCRMRESEDKPFSWFRIRYSIIKDKDGKFIKAVATAQNIDAQHSFERIFSLVLQRNNIALSELDLKTHALRITGNSVLPVGHIIENAPQGLIDSGHYTKESEKKLTEIYEKIYAGSPEETAEICSFDERRNGMVWRSVCLTAVEDGRGERTKAICTVRNITPFKKMEQRYEEEMLFKNDFGSSLISESRVNLTKCELEAFFVGNEDISLRFTEDKERFSALSKYAERSVYYLSENKMTKEQSEKFSPEKLLELYSSGCDRFKLSYLARDKSGKFLWIDAHCHIMRRPNTGELIAFFYNTDASDEHTKEQITGAVLGLDYDFAGIIYGDGSAVILSEKENGESALQKFDSYDELAKVRTESKIFGDDREGNTEMVLLPAITRGLSQKGEYSAELDIMCGGEVRRKRYKYIYNDFENKIIAFTRSDIEDAIAIEREKQRELSETAQRAEKASRAKTEFLSRMSHEIRTPLSGVMGLIKLCLEESDITVIREYLLKMDLSGQHLGSLINDILDMSKIESGEIELHPAAFQFSDFESALLAVMTPLCEGKNLNFHFEKPQYHHPVFIDRTRFNQILYNLLSNAVKFTPNGGNVSLIYKNKPDGDFLLMDFFVEDDGIGMSEEFQRHMFEPFSQESQKVVDSVQGTGLGLGIAKAFAELMGGDLTVKSAPGMGTSFHLSLRVPLAKENDVYLKTDNADINFSGKTILVAEDSPINRMIVTKLLEKKGARVIECTNGNDALETFAKSGEKSIDAVLMDIRMPVMNGFEATRAIRALGREDAAEVPIIAMTANAYDEDRRAAKNAGMNEHIAKPVDTKLLFSVLERFMS